jgi:hypothetical protein
VSTFGTLAKHYTVGGQRCQARKHDGDDYWTIYGFGSITTHCMQNIGKVRWRDKMSLGGTVTRLFTTQGKQHRTLEKAIQHLVTVWERAHPPKRKIELMCEGRVVRTLELPVDAEDVRVTKDWRVIVSWTVPSDRPTHTRIQQSDTFIDLSLSKEYVARG